MSRISRRAAQPRMIRSAIIATSAVERANLARFEEMDAKLAAVRNALRNGERIE